MTMTERHPNAMSEREIAELAYELLAENGIHNYRVTFSNRMVRTIGVCYYDLRELRFASKVAAVNDRSLTEDVVRHEVAHAVVGPGHGHGEVWKAAARRLGAKPRAGVRAGEMVSVPRVDRWVAVCDACGVEAGSRRQRPSADRDYHHVAKYCAANGGTIRWVDKRA